MTPTPPHKRGVMYVTLKEHLARLEAIESTKPEHQRTPVPSMAHLARVAGIAANTMSRWVTGETESTTHSIVGAVISELRARGFNTDIGDILAYREVE